MKPFFSCVYLQMYLAVKLIGNICPQADFLQSQQLRPPPKNPTQKTPNGYKLKTLRELRPVILVTQNTPLPLPMKT